MTDFRIPGRAARALELRDRPPRRVEWRGLAATYSPEEQAWMLDAYVWPGLAEPAGSEGRLRLAREALFVHEMKARLGARMRDDVELVLLGDGEGATAAAPST